MATSIASPNRGALSKANGGRPPRRLTNGRLLIWKRSSNGGPRNAQSTRQASPATIYAKKKKLCGGRRKNSNDAVRKLKLPNAARKKRRSARPPNHSGARSKLKLNAGRVNIAS